MRLVDFLHYSRADLGPQPQIEEETLEQVSTGLPPLRRNATATTVILLINLLIYVAVEIQGGPTYDNLIRFGAKENGLIADGEWFRLIAPMFLHAGILHLGFNMWALFQVGRILELMIGPRNFVTIYLAGGLTSTLCSFALSPALSVGASGCLYAILLALFVLQRYEERLAKDLGLATQPSPLGTLIILNGLITFVIPNIDWAAHLGGALAGALLALALVMRHRWRMRLERCRPFLDPTSPMPHRRLWEHAGLYVWGLAILNFGFSLGYFRVTELDRSFGRGMLRAANIREVPREPSQLSQFGKLITSPRSETNPRHLLSLAVTLHQRHLYLPAFLGYHGALLIAEQERGALPETDVITAHGLMTSAYRGEQGNPVLFSALELDGSLDNVAPQHLAEQYMAAAELLGQLRFFGIAAKLSETAFLLASNNLDYASATFAHLKKVDNLSDVMRFRDIAERLMPPDVDPALAGQAADLKAVQKWQDLGRKSLNDFLPSTMWTLRNDPESGPSPEQTPQPKSPLDFLPPI